MRGARRPHVAPPNYVDDAAAFELIGRELHGHQAAIDLTCATVASMIKGKTPEGSAAANRARLRKSPLFPEEAAGSALTAPHRQSAGLSRAHAPAFPSRRQAQARDTPQMRAPLRRGRPRDLRCVSQS